MLRSDQPSNRNKLIFRNLAGALYALTVSRAAIHLQLIDLRFPIKNYLVGRITNPKICGIGLRNNRNLDRRAECIRRSELVRAFQNYSVASGQPLLARPLAGPLRDWLCGVTREGDQDTHDE